MKTIKHYAPFVKAAKLFGIPIRWFFSLRENDLKEIYNMKIVDEIELVVDYSNMLGNVELPNYKIMIMLDNSDPTIKNINYKIVITAGEIYKNLLKVVDNSGNILYGLDIRLITSTQFQGGGII